MALKHDNPTQPRTDQDRHQHWAVAPYNFVPLPEKVVMAQAPLGHDEYRALTGAIDCTLETCAPTYVRGMLMEEQFARFGQKKSEQLSEDEKREKAPFFAVGEKNNRRPVIPGSTLRGMIRTLVEIAGFGRLRWASKEPPFTFRAVAAAKDDPLREPYQTVLGAFGKNVRAGYLEKENNRWRVRPAKTPEDMKWPERGAYYLKVKERMIGGKDISNFIRLDSENYRPQLHLVSFGVEFRKSKRGPYVTISQIGDRDADYEHQGVLVCSGNMAETAKKGQMSPRKNHALVLEANSKATPLPISKQALEDYRHGLTPFQKEELRFDWAGGEWGCLKVGAPVFYVVEEKEVAYFGHCPNFRVPARLFKEKRAATPRDFVPSAAPSPDLAEAIFGWVEEDHAPFPEGQCAGRVYFEDASCISPGPDFWLEQHPLTLHTLTSPKPTTFQHYLVQNKNQDHDPDRKVSLAHYGTPPDQTEIRGFKLYWHKGAGPEIVASTKEREHPDQLTQVVPLRPGIKFSFRIRFENLREEELGALLWALALPGEPNQQYRHKLGMGKPLGMGAVKIAPQLYVSDRPSRYGRLFENNDWHEAAVPGDPKTYVQAFEDYVRTQLGDSQSLLQRERIRMLLAMLQWREQVDDAWREKTRYMEIERGAAAVNEYKERPVLPDPLAVLQQNVSPQPPPQEERQYGKVKNFGLGQKKDFGFIQPEKGGDDLYVRKDQIKNAATLAPGQRVSFKIARSEKGLRAIEVQVETHQ